MKACLSPCTWLGMSRLFQQLIEYREAYLRSLNEENDLAQSAADRRAEEEERARLRAQHELPRDPHGEAYKLCVLFAPLLHVFS